jgi:ribosomal protein S18 acetylase RimI-like enzyme
MTIRVRKALPEDGRAIQEIYYRSWLATYPNEILGVTTDDVEAIFKDTFTEESLSKFSDNLAKLPEDILFLVAESDSKIVGLCRITVRDEFNQLQSIYVLPEYERQGVGSALWNEATRLLGEHKDSVVHVSTYNEKAIAFYKKLGFEDTGKRFTEERHKMPISGVYLPEMEMKKTTR